MAFLEIRSSLSSLLRKRLPNPQVWVSVVPAGHSFLQVTPVFHRKGWGVSLPLGLHTSGNAAEMLSALSHLVTQNITKTYSSLLWHENNFYCLIKDILRWDGPVCLFLVLVQGSEDCNDSLVPPCWFMLKCQQFTHHCIAASVQMLTQRERQMS